MKKTNFFIKNCLVIAFCFLVNFVYSQPTPIGYIDVIVVFKTPADAIFYKALFKATELDSSKPSQARLWRIRKGTTVLLNGISITINNTGDAIGAIGGRPKSIGVGENGIVTLAYGEDIGTFPPIPPLTTCPNNSRILPCGQVQAQQGRKIRVYVLDTGIELGTNNMPINPILAPYVDMRTAYNFVINNKFPKDDNGHGMAVSGIIQQYLKFIDGDVKIVPIKVLDKNGQGYTFDVIKAIDKANNEKADFVNCSLIIPSLFFPNKPSPLQISIDKARTNELLVISGAGNNNKDIDIVPNYPASLPCDNQIVTGSIGCSETKSSFSNFGERNVDVFTYGEAIGSLGPNKTFVRCTGTSFSCPIIVGMASVLASQLPQKDYKKIKQAILSTTDYNNNLTRACGTQGTANLCNALFFLLNNPPFAPQIVSQSPINITQQPILPISNEELHITPNIFAANSNISFKLDKMSRVTINIYNIGGVKIKTLLDEIRASGEYTIPIESNSLPPNMYLCTMESENVHLCQKFQIIK